MTRNFANVCKAHVRHAVAVGKDQIPQGHHRPEGRDRLARPGSVQIVVPRGKAAKPRLPCTPSTLLRTVTYLHGTKNHALRRMSVR